MYLMGDDVLTLLLNGEAVGTQFLAGAPDTPGAVQKATLTLKPGDVLGFRCVNKSGSRYFCMIARAGVRQLFSTSERWEAMPDPDEAWLKGEGKATARPAVLRSRVDYGLAEATRFESLARAHSVDYDMLWAGSENTVGFRYVIRPADLPDRPVAR